jgi:hypothetical protein
MQKCFIQDMSGKHGSATDRHPTLQLLVSTNLFHKTNIHASCVNMPAEGLLYPGQACRCGTNRGAVQREPMCVHSQLLLLLLVKP